MSASLVGSEMCIRDSCCGKGGRVLPLLDCVRANRAARSRPRPEIQQSWACLLYTSDAADDM
eukprot:4896884-Alexandrium_andersonii.AAC.1